MNNVTVSSPLPDAARAVIAHGKWLLLAMGVISIAFGLSEILSGVLPALLALIRYEMPFTLPWERAMLSSSGGQIYMATGGIIFAVMYIALGVMGLLFANSPKMAKTLVFICLGVFVIHIVFLVISFLSGGFIYLSILLLFIPIVYMVGAAQNLRSEKVIKNTVVAYSFITPNLVGFSIFTMIPMIFALALAFMQWDLRDNSFIFVGFENFMRMRTDHLFWPSFRNTLLFTAMFVPITMVCALGLALLLNNKIRGRSIFRSIMFFPHVASLIAMAAVWNQIFHPSWGPVNQFLGFLGIENLPRWSLTPWVLPNIAFFSAWRNMGYFMIIYLAGLQSIPKELYEAASIDGANAWTKFVYITWPQLRFVTFFVTVMLTILSFRVFDQVIMITNTETPGTGATMLVVHIFRVAFINWNMGYASSIAMVLLALALSATIIQFLIQRKHEQNY